MLQFWTSHNQQWFVVVLSCLQASYLLNEYALKPEKSSNWSILRRKVCATFIFPQAGNCPTDDGKKVIKGLQPRIFCGHWAGSKEAQIAFLYPRGPISYFVTFDPGSFEKWSFNFSRVLSQINNERAFLFLIFYPSRCVASITQEQPKVSQKLVWICTSLF